MRKGRWSGQTLLDVALRALFTVMGGERLVDDTLAEKPSAARLAEAAWVWSTKPNQGVFGLPGVRLVWTNGQVRLPLAGRIGQKGGPSNFAWALEWRSYARPRLRVKPRFGLFAAWSPSKAGLKRRREYGWDLGCQGKQTRLLAGKPVRDSTRQPSWQAVGTRSGGIKGRGVNYRRKDDVTHRLRRPAQELRATDKRRHAIAAGFRVLKEQLRLAAWHAGYSRLGNEKSHAKEGVQAPHMALCLIADLSVARERMNPGVTLRHLRRTRSVRGLEVSRPSLTRVRMAA